METKSKLKDMTTAIVLYFLMILFICGCEGIPEFKTENKDYIILYPIRSNTELLDRDTIFIQEKSFFLKMEKILSHFDNTGYMCGYTYEYHLIKDNQIDKVKKFNHTCLDSVSRFEFDSLISSSKASFNLISKKVHQSDISNFGKNSIWYVDRLNGINWRYITFDSLGKTRNNSNEEYNRIFSAFQNNMCLNYHDLLLSSYVKDFPKLSVPYYFFISDSEKCLSSVLDSLGYKHMYSISSRSEEVGVVEVNFN